jgi:glycosyltransferase involved in cell wall biosynthesis
MRVLHVTEKINEKAGGTSVHICKLAAATADLNLGPVEIVMFDLEHLGSQIATAPNVKTVILPKSKPYLYGRSRAFRQYVETAAQDPESIFHVHNMWRLPMVYGCQSARRHGRPCVVSPHGALNSWALTVNPLPKKLMWRLVEERRLRRSSVVRATSMFEADFLRRLVPKATIAVIPPGTDLPDLSRRPARKGPRTALFLSRIIPNKGLLTLIRAWAQVRPRDWKLEVYGTDFQNHLAECRQAVAESGLEPVVHFNAAAYQEKKWEPYLNADLFILPTISENFGIAIAEALASSVPVITTQAAPWEDLTREQCGWWVGLGLEPLVKAMNEAVEMAPAELARMGTRGRGLVEKKFCWPSIAKEMVTLYQWIQGGPKPETIL